MIIPRLWPALHARGTLMICYLDVGKTPDNAWNVIYADFPCKAPICLRREENQLLFHGQLGLYSIKCLE